MLNSESQEAYSQSGLMQPCFIVEETRGQEKIICHPLSPAELDHNALRCETQQTSIHLLIRMILVNHSNPNFSQHG